YARPHDRGRFQGQHLRGGNRLGPAGAEVQDRGRTIRLASITPVSLPGLTSRYARSSGTRKRIKGALSCPGRVQRGLLQPEQNETRDPAEEARSATSRDHAGNS